MHIQITKTFSDLGITHTEGTREHVAASVAERYFEAKVAAPVKYASIAERFAVDEALRVAAIPEHLRETPDIKWGVRRLPTSEKWVVTSSQLGTNLIYGPPMLMDRGRPDFAASEKQFVATLKKAKCPQSVIDTYLAKSRG